MTLRTSGKLSAISSPGLQSRLHQLAAQLAAKPFAQMDLQLISIQFDKKAKAVAGTRTHELNNILNTLPASRQAFSSNAIHSKHRYIRICFRRCSIQSRE